MFHVMHKARHLVTVVTVSRACAGVKQDQTESGAIGKYFAINVWRDCGWIHITASSERG